jgi:hypothetical protein
LKDVKMSFAIHGVDVWTCGRHGSNAFTGFARSIGRQAH